jgi:hypothetical protein
MLMYVFDGKVEEPPDAELAVNSAFRLTVPAK